MVAGAYVLPSLSLSIKPVNAELTDELLASYVSKDTDSDGLPDWQEALYGTDSNKADTDGDGISDGEAVRRGLLTPTALAPQLPQEGPITEEDIPGEAPAPGSLTERFSREFFDAYVKASNGQPMSNEARDALVANLLNIFTQRAAAEVGSSYTSLSVRTDPSIGTTEYVQALENLLQASTVKEGSADPLVLAEALIQKNDVSAVPKLDALADSYSEKAATLLEMRVPPELAANHLKLIRAYDALGKVTRVLADYKQDPLAVLGAVGRIVPNSAEVVAAIQDIAVVILRSGEPAPNGPGAYIVMFARAAQQ